MKNKLICALALAGVVGTLASCGGNNALSIGVGTLVAEPTVSHGDGMVEVNFATAIYEGDKVVASLVDVYQVKLDQTQAALKDANPLSKRDLHDAYAMKDTSAAAGKIEGGAEWWEQAAALETYTEGKSEFDETAEDLTAGCTMSTGDLFAVVTEAKTNTKGKVSVAGGEYTYALGHFLNPIAEEGVLTQVDISFVGLLLDSNNKVVTAYVDEVQIPLTFNADAEGCKYTITPTNAYNSATIQYNYKGQTIASKKELGYDYGMKGTSAKNGVIDGGAEWFEQAAAWEDYIVGKSISDLTATDEVTGCTMDTTTYVAAAQNAIDSSLYNSKKVTL